MVGSGSLEATRCQGVDRNSERVATAYWFHNLPGAVTQNVTQNSAGSQFRNTPTGPAMARPHACHLCKLNRPGESGDLLV